jgi:hypothetical protein
MKPFTSIKEAEAELKDMSPDDLKQLSDMTNKLLDENQISEEQYDFVMTLLLNEAMDRITSIINDVAFDEQFGVRVPMPEHSTTIH